MNYEDTKKSISKYVAKMSMSGIAIDIQYLQNEADPEDFTVIMKSIKAADSDAVSQLPVSIKALNNGNIVLPEQIVRFGIDMNEINYKMQSQDFIKYILDYMHATLVYGLNEEKFNELESVVKEHIHLRSPATIAMDCVEAYDRILMAIDWLGIKSMKQVHMLDKLVCATDTDLLLTFEETIVQFEDDSLSKTDDDAYYEELGELLTQINKNLERAIGTGLDIFDGDVSEHQNYMKRTVYEPHWTQHELAIIYEIDDEINELREFIQERNSYLFGE
jgi:hypothetical protein